MTKAKRSVKPARRWREVNGISAKIEPTERDSEGASVDTSSDVFGFCLMRSYSPGWNRVVLLSVSGRDAAGLYDGSRAVFLPDNGRLVQRIAVENQQVPDAAGFDDPEVWTTD